MSLMGTKNGRKQHTAELKAKVVIAAIKGQHTTSELASMYGVHATQIGIWKKKALEELGSYSPAAEARRSENRKT